VLNSLRLVNFRRHVDTEIDFSDDAQIIAITGANGAGKSTVLEALTFSLYGEGRHGRRGLSKLVRRGAEFEGMQVELEFTVDDVHYKIYRRYDSGKSSAKLFINGNDATQSPDAVTREVTRILGMDATGFRLAVIAQQGDVEGLADLTAAKRKQTISRLLRQDALTNAAREARDIHNRELDIWKAMGSGPDLDDLTSEHAAAVADAAAALTAVTDSRDTLVTLDAELAATKDVEDTWHEAQLILARADATATAARAEADRISAELAGVHVPDEMPAGERSVTELMGAISEVNVAIAKGEAERELAASAEATRSDLDKVTAQLAEVATLLGSDTPASVAMALSKLGGQMAEAEAEKTAAAEKYDELRTAHATLQAQLADVTRRAEAAAGLGDVCETCEQEISDDHKHRQATERAKTIADLKVRTADTVKDGTAAAAAVKAVEEKLSELRGQREELIRRRAAVDAACRTRTDLQRRAEQYQARLARITATPVDLEALFAEKGRLEVARAQAEQAEQVAASRKAAMARRDQLSAALSDAQGRLAAALAEHEAAAPDADLVAAYQRRRELLTQRADEAELVAAVEQEAALAAERVKSVQRAIDDARAHRDRALVHRKNADKAAKAAQVLKDTAAKMATLIRPALEAEVSTLLSELSEGRFTRVKVSEDYELTVEDDGVFEPLSEFSGGQRVMIALATRLALANVVAERHGNGGVGFLILDEVFGSQDETRREAILSSLRTMRALYGQILLISHVGGFDEAADRVLEVSEGSEDGRRTAQVTAA